MLDSIKLGQYLHGDSWYYRLDPRGKLILTTLFIVVIFLANSLITFLGAAVFTLIIVLSSGVSLKYFYRSIKPIFFLILITFVLNLFFIKTGKPLPPVYLLYSQALPYVKYAIYVYGLIVLITILLRIMKLTQRNISGKIFKYSTLIIIITEALLMVFMRKGQLLWHLDIYEDALVNGGLIILRLILIISFSSLLTFTTKPTDLTLAIEHVLGPLKIIKLPVSELALMISISLRFIPTLLEETQKILKAQTSRGADFTEGNLKDKVVQIISLLIPMFIISFKRAEDLANAMEARGYVPGKPRTSLKELKWCLRDSLYSFSFILFTGFLLYFRYFNK